MEELISPLLSELLLISTACSYNSKLLFLITLIEADIEEVYSFNNSNIALKVTTASFRKVLFFERRKKEAILFPI
jgi:hypothetical protein